MVDINVVTSKSDGSHCGGGGGGVVVVVEVVV